MNMSGNPYVKEADPFAGEQGQSTMEHGGDNYPQAPHTRPRTPTSYEDQKVEVSEDTLKKIKTGFVAALISGTLTLVFTLIATLGSDVTGFLDAWAFIDVVLIFALAVGIYFKSRVASTTMFVYFLASKIYIWESTGQMSGVFMAIVFIYFFFQAMTGTYEYHREKKGA